MNAVSTAHVPHVGIQILFAWTCRCWGWNEDGQLGSGPSRSRSIFEPMLVTFENRSEFGFLEAEV
jgi:alpha-tubulin suppressor-like RCC1 family protein